VSLNGAVVKQDKDSTRDFYGHMVRTETSLTGAVPAPETARPFLETLAKWAKEASEK
jgi:lipid-binding SYLF domain-containing protein